MKTITAFPLLNNANNFRKVFISFAKKKLLFAISDTKVSIFFSGGSESSSYETELHKMTSHFQLLTRVRKILN